MDCIAVDLKVQLPQNSRGTPFASVDADRTQQLSGGVQVGDGEDGLRGVLVATVQQLVRPRRPVPVLAQEALTSELIAFVNGAQDVTAIDAVPSEHVSSITFSCRCQTSHSSSALLMSDVSAGCSAD